METTILNSTVSQEEQDMFRTISLTALLAGTLDIAAAIAQRYIETGKGPLPIFKFIASGIFGKEALSGGTLMIIWGIVFHFMIAFLFTAFLFLIHPKVTAWLKNRFITGIVYGILIWAIMNLVVVPLTITHKLPSSPQKVIIEGLILICMIGLPVALMAHRFYSRSKAS